MTPTPVGWVVTWVEDGEVCRSLQDTDPADNDFGISYLREIATNGRIQIGDDLIQQVMTIAEHEAIIAELKRKLT